MYCSNRNPSNNPSERRKGTDDGILADTDYAVFNRTLLL